jgi:hypothetical protein
VGGKGGRCVRLTTLPHSCADCLEIWEPQPPGTLRVCSGLYRDCFTFYISRRCEYSSQHPLNENLRHTKLWCPLLETMLPMYLMLYIFLAVVYYTDFIINQPTTALFYNFQHVSAANYLAIIHCLLSMKRVLLDDG